MATRSTVSAVSAGMIASLVDSIVFTAARTSGFTSYNKEFLMARVFTASWHPLARSPGVWLYGLFLSVIVGGIVGWFYALGFKWLRPYLRSGWDTGIGLGVVHWLIAGLVLGVVHSSLSPGFFGVDLETPTFTLLFLTHILFGAIVGGLYLPPAVIVARGDLELPENDHINHEEDYIRKAS
jgi:hypothetical protein